MANATSHVFYEKTSIFNGMRFAFNNGMNANLQAMVSKYAVITFPAWIENEGDGQMTLKVGRNELSKLIEKEMACRLEMPDRSSRNVKIKDIERNSGELFLLCCSTRQGGET